MDYRDQARQAYERAKVELFTNDDNRLKYAALELRMAFESLIYKKAEGFKSELAAVDLDVWQPRKLLALLLELDPHADKSGEISFGLEEKYGEPAKQMTSLGKDRVLSLAEIRKYYDRLGSYLHTPTLSQVSESKAPSSKTVRDRCSEVCGILNEVFSSKVFNTDFKQTSQITCGGCGVAIVRRVPHDTTELVAKCINCVASYTLANEGDGKIKWTPRENRVLCANPACESEILLWERETNLGARWVCKQCEGTNRFELGVSFYPKQE